jgi:hypothetical protein
MNFKSRENPSSREEKSRGNEGESQKNGGHDIVINSKKQVKENSQDLSNLGAKKSIGLSVNSPTKASKKKISSKNIAYQKSQPQLINKPSLI